MARGFRGICRTRAECSKRVCLSCFLGNGKGETASKGHPRGSAIALGIRLGTMELEKQKEREDLHPACLLAMSFLWVSRKFLADLGTGIKQ